MCKLVLFVSFSIYIFPHMQLQAFESIQKYAIFKSCCYIFTSVNFNQGKVSEFWKAVWFEKEHVVHYNTLYLDTNVKGRQGIFMFIIKEYGLKKKGKHCFQSLRDDILLRFNSKSICKLLKTRFTYLSLVTIQGNIMSFSQLSRSEFYKDLFYCREIDIKDQSQFVLLEVINMYSRGVTEGPESTVLIKEASLMDA